MRFAIFPQQRKLMGNSSGVHWCWFNEVPEKVPEGSALVRKRSSSTRSRIRFRRRFQEALVQAPGQVQLREGSGEGSGRFRRRFWRRFRRRFQALVQVPGQVQEGSGKVPVQRGSIEGSGRRWWRARRGSTRFRKVPEKQFNDVPEKVAEKVPERPWPGQGSGRCRRRFREMLVQSRARFNEVLEGLESGEGFREGSGTPWCRGGPGSSRFRCDSGSVLAQLWGQFPANFGRTILWKQITAAVGDATKAYFSPRL